MNTTKDTLCDNAYEFINNMKSFSELISGEVSCYSAFKNAQCASFIDSYFNNYAAKFTLKLVFDWCTVTVNFHNKYGNLSMDYKVRQGRKVIEKHDESFGGDQLFEWDTVTPEQAYGNMIKSFRRHLNELINY